MVDALYAANLLYLMKGNMLNIVPKLGHKFPDFQGMSTPMSRNVEDSENCPNLGQVNPNVYPHIMTAHGLTHDYLPLSFQLSEP